MFRYCNSCAKLVEVELDWKAKRGGGYHLGEFCSECKQWISWLKQTAGNVRQAPPRPELDVAN